MVRRPAPHPARHPASALTSMVLVCGAPSAFLPAALIGRLAGRPWVWVTGFMTTVVAAVGVALGHTPHRRRHLPTRPGYDFGLAGSVIAWTVAGLTLPALPANAISDTEWAGTS